jgi:hypothetical protein
VQPVILDEASRREPVPRDEPSLVDPIARSPGRGARSVGALVRWLPVAAIAIVTVGALVLPGSAIFLRPALWGVVLLTSMAGWGRVFERLAFSPQRFRSDIGLRLAWSAAGMLAVGGLLCLISLATRPVLMTMVLGGTLLCAYDQVRRNLRSAAKARGVARRWPLGVVVALAALSLLLAIQYCAGATGKDINPFDDSLAYLVFPEEILAAGTFIEPFSLRRMGAFGGQSFLHALTLLRTVSPFQASILDLGISPAIVLALILGAADGRTPRELGVLLVLFVLTLPDLRANSASEMSGVVFLLAMYRTATWVGSLDRPAAGAAALGLVGAAACTLRHSYLAPVCLFMTLVYLPATIAGLSTRWSVGRRHLTAVSAAAGSLLVFVLPWALLAYRSNGTLLFPLVSGNYNPAFRIVDADSQLADRLQLLWLNIFHPFPVRSLPFVLLAGMFIPWRRTHGALPALLCAAFGSFVMVVYQLPLLDAADLARYYYASHVATVLAVMIAAFSSPWNLANGADRVRAAIPAVLVAGAIAVHLESIGSKVFTDYGHMGDRISAMVKYPWKLKTDAPDHRELQESIPEGAAILAILDEPFWLDFGRNRIDIIDIPGAVSPDGPIPFDSDEALVKYLGAHGYQHIAFIRPDLSRGLYQRANLTRMMSTSSNPIAKATAPFYLQLFDRLDSLTRSRRVLYDDGRLVALDLGALTEP